MNRRYVIAIVAIMATFLGVIATPQSSPVTPPATVERAAPTPVRSTQAPPAPPLPALAPVHEGVVRVAVVLPNSQGSTGQSLRDIAFAERTARSASRPAPPPEPEGIDGVRIAFGVFGASPIDLAATLGWLHPGAELAGISQEIMWIWEDEAAGQTVSPGRRTHIRQALLQFIHEANDTSQAREARFYLLELDLDDTPPEAQSQLIWDRFVANFRNKTPGGAQFMLDQRNVHANIALEDHALFAAPTGIHNPDWDDRFLRDALAKGDAEWTQYWWHHLELSSDRPTASEEWRSRWSANRDQLAGAVGDLIGEARSWQDGLRVAAVSCARSTDAHPFSTEIVYQDDHWLRVDNTRPDAFETCIYTSSEPAAVQTQHALLVVEVSP